MSIRFTILASGSTGNAMVVDSGEARLLVDAGFSGRKLEQLLQQRGLSCEQLDGLLITHEHADHVKGAGVLARKHGLQIYANEKTWQAMEKQIGEVKEEQRKYIVTGEKLDFGSMTVDTFPLSHDAADPIGYSFYDGDCKVSIVTDTGYVSPAIKEKIRESDVIILEANHDIDMLRAGHYPWNVKRRILSDVGHLSNHDAGEVLFDLIHERTQRVYLAHLSRDHNLQELASLTVQQVVEEMGISLQERNIRLMNTYYDRPTEWDHAGRKEVPV